MKILVILFALLANSLHAQNLNFGRADAEKIALIIEANEPDSGKYYYIVNDMGKTDTLKFLGDADLAIGIAGTANVYNVVATFDTLSLYYQLYLSDPEKGAYGNYERPYFHYPLPAAEIVSHLDSLVKHLLQTSADISKTSYILSFKLYPYSGDSQKTTLVIGQYLISGNRKNLQSYLSNVIGTTFKSQSMTRKFLQEIVGAPPLNEKAMSVKNFEHVGNIGEIKLYIFRNTNTYSIYLQSN